MYSSIINRIYLCEPQKAHDNRYHYLYKVVNNINEKFYYGIHSTSNIFDNYAGSGASLKLAYKKYGEQNFNMYIVEAFENRKELLIREQQIVNAETIANPQCYNMVLGGTGHLYSKFSVRGTDDKKYYITKQEFLSHPELYAERTTSGRIHMHRDDENILVYPDDVELYLEKGFKRGQNFISTLGKIVIFNTQLNRSKFIPESQLQQYLAEGWVRGGKTRNKCQKSFAKNQIWINNGTICKRVNHSELNDYIELGWARGPLQRTNIGKIAITNGHNNLFISANESIPDGYWKGMTTSRIKMIWIHLDSERKMVPVADIDKYLADGWIKGRNISVRPNAGKKAIHRDGLVKMVPVADIDKYLADGWMPGNPKSGGDWRKRIKKNG